MNNTSETVGRQLREWRQRRRLSQLALASEVEISQRHLSFVESGRARPSRDMVLLLSEYLDVPLRARNTMLTAAGHAPHYPHHRLDTPEQSGMRGMIEKVLHGHLPHPALAVDRHWDLICANAAAQRLMSDAAPHLLTGEVNVLRLSLHPEGLAPRILNLAEWHAHLLNRLDHDISYSADARLAQLRDELAAYPVSGPGGNLASDAAQAGSIAIPLRLKGDAGPLSFLSTTTVFGTAVDVALSEVTIEAFFPADDRTAQALA
ncbi:helix-turn-helix transcriptional regulator [Sulfitobacter sp. G21635-S1]|uniref:helix-turn-helix domain-containing protein n=1 Tax=Sulfitobacter sp. G21635-S1 TaxID=3014043 RepID=UPI0022AF1C43|nr:helix-turn-helix transcriptional regulator [Sulfitobacter sp. G21635-S1]MCZ4253977.1 helix-turn-helix transcriptional regulator [Sulfitobacter sp. G21635-S1]